MRLRFLTHFLAVLVLVVVLVAPQPTSAQPAAEAAAPSANTPPIINAYVSIAPPFTFKDDKGEWHGLSVDILKMVANDLKIRIDWHQVELQDIVSSVAGDPIGVGLGPFYPTSRNEQVVDFSHAYMTSQLAIGALHRNRSTYWFKLFDDLFTPTAVWLGFFLVVAGLVAGTTIWLIERARNPQQFGGGSSEGMIHGWWWAMVTMTTVGYGDKTPITNVGRLIALVWMIVSVVAVACLTASITAAVTSSQWSEIRTPRDLLHLEVGTTEGSGSQRFLTMAQVSTLTFPTPRATVEAVMRHEVDACVLEDVVLRQAAVDAGAQLDIYPFTYQEKNYTLIFPNHAAWTDAINASLLQATETSEWAKVRARYARGALDATTVY